LHYTARTTSWIGNVAEADGKNHVARENIHLDYSIQGPVIVDGAVRAVKGILDL
jgi:hypothetical protein